MEIVSNRLSLTAASPPASVRHLERKATFSSPPQRSNGRTSSQRMTQSRRESLTGSSLMSLKAYYRKLRTFKGTIKALISFRRMPTFVARTSSVPRALGSSLLQLADEDSAAVVEGAAPRVIDAVVKLADDENALQKVKDQVKELVEKGHVVTELDPTDKDDVTYRLQGNLEHYTEENLRKRLKLQEHPHMVALTQRLWLAANHEDEAQLSFGEYEAYMLRLHRLILPEFDLAQSKELIKDDWVRDTDGSDHLDYRFFHFSMFELVDLWTDTVDAEDYISLLYCIMHCLTFTWNDRHILKDLDDVIAVDILEASKMVTMEEIEHDISHEVNSESAQMYRDRVACEDEEEPTITGDNDGSIELTRTPSTDQEIARTQSTEKGDVGSKASRHRKPSGRHNTSPASSAVTHTPSSPSKTANDHKSTGGKLTPRFSTMGGDQVVLTPPSGTDGEAELAVSQDHTTTEAALASRLPPARLTSGNSSQHEGGGVSSHLSVQGRQQGSGDGGTRGGSTLAGPRVLYSPVMGNQYGSGADGTNGPISITSLGASSEFISMVSKPSFIRKPSVMNSASHSRQGDRPDGSISHAVLGLGLQAGQSLVGAGIVEGDVPASGGLVSTPRQSVTAFPRAPHPRQSTGKESESRQGSLVAGDPLHSPPIVYGGYGNVSPRARSAKSQARVSSPAASQLTLSGTVATGETAAVVAGGSIAPLAALPLAMDDGHSLEIASRRNTRKSTLARPASSSPSPRNLSVHQPQNGALTDYLQTRAYQDTSLKLGQPLPRTSRVYQQRVSLAPDLVISTLGNQSLTATRDASKQTRPSLMQQAASVNHRAFAGSVVGTSKLSFEASPNTRSPSQRGSTTTGTTGRIPASLRKPTSGELRLGLSMGTTTSPARLELHTHSLSPRKA